MSTKLEQYVRQRTKSLKRSLAEVCRLAGISRQTLYECWQGDSYPSLNTLVALAWALEVHPLRLLQLVFSDVALPRHVRNIKPGDRSAFVRDVTCPDGAPVLAGSHFRKCWALQNVGEVPWHDRYLTCQDEEIVVFSERGEELSLAPNLMPEASRIAVPETAPGETVELCMTFTAPATPGTVLSYWKMTFADGTPCFPEAYGVWAKVMVVTPTKAAGARQERVATG